MQKIIAERKRYETVKSFLLISGLLLLYTLVVLIFTGPGGLLLLGVVPFGLVLFLSTLPLTISIQGANKLSYADAPEVFHALSRLTHKAGLDEQPELYYFPVNAGNAMTLGSADRPKIILTQGLLNSLSTQEIAAVLAHEISHIKNNDLVLFRVADIVRRLTGVISQAGVFLLVLYLPFWLSDSTRLPLSMFVLFLLAPIVSIIVNYALFREREFYADLTAVEMTGTPMVLASALDKIENPPRSVFERLFNVSRPAKKRNGSIFRTHPDTGRRMEILKRIERGRTGGLPRNADS